MDLLFIVASQRLLGFVLCFFSSRVSQNFLDSLLLEHP